jgi:hypothetical protein
MAGPLHGEILKADSMSSEEMMILPLDGKIPNQDTFEIRDKCGLNFLFSSALRYCIIFKMRGKFL